MRRNRLHAVAAAAALLVITVAAAAQQAAFKLDGTAARRSVGPRARGGAGDRRDPGRRLRGPAHPSGEEVGYVLEGTVLVEIDGKPASTLKAGVFHHPSPGPFTTRPTRGGGGAKVLATYIIEKGKPVATPAK
jgi:hypothetical protein